MPIYPYRCPKCDQVHEQIHKFEDDPEPCETEGCGHKLTQEHRLMTSAGFQFQAVKAGADGQRPNPTSSNESATSGQAKQN